MADKVNSGRRSFLALSLLAAGGLRYPAGSASQANTDASATPLSELGYGQVQLSEGPLDRQARENHRLILSLDEDSLLRTFRVRAGLAAPGHELGGWYDTDAFAPGATFGQWMSALSRFYAITADAPTRAKVRRLVHAYAATIDTEGSFYRKNRFPAYTYDKLVGGLLDAKRLSHDDTAPATLSRATHAALPYLPPRCATAAAGSRHP